MLDQEAQERGTSVYLVDRVLPMLPQRLSNGICSLNEKEDRLVMSCEMEIEAETGRITKYRIFPAVIHSHHRLSYNLVRAILEEGDKKAREDYADIVPMLEEMRELCRVLQKKRARRGAIEFDLPEQKVILDEAGKPLEIKQRIHGLPTDCRNLSLKSLCWRPTKRWRGIFPCSSGPACTGSMSLRRKTRWKDWPNCCKALM